MHESQRCEVPNPDSVQVFSFVQRWAWRIRACFDGEDPRFGAGLNEHSQRLDSQSPGVPGINLRYRLRLTYTAPPYAKVTPHAFGSEKHVAMWLPDGAIGKSPGDGAEAVPVPQEGDGTPEEPTQPEIT